jgi:(2Fe-2S) ferredoxin
MNKLTLDNFHDRVKGLRRRERAYIKVGLSSCGIAAGADKVFEVLKQEVKSKKLDIEVLKCGCAGMCYAEPLVEVYVEGMQKVLYGKVDEDVALKIVRKHVVNKKLINNHIYSIKD